MIVVKNLVKKFGRATAVDGVSFTVPTGQAIALWGDNGAGKTTVIRCILGLLPCQGTISVNGFDVRRHGKASRRAIGYVPQELALYDDLRLPEALAFFARLKRVETSRAETVLDEVGLTVHRHKRVGALSGGMKRRMALAVALLADPPVLLLDELTSNLDATAQEGFMALLARLKSRGKTILFTSHHIDEVELLADRVLVLESGRIIADRPAATLAEAHCGRCTLDVYLADDGLDEAVAVLRTRGFDVARNGEKLHVRVTAGAKAAPIRALAAANIGVRDFALRESPARGTEATNDA